MRRLPAALLILLILAAPAAADVIKTVSTEYYAIRGTNKQAIAIELAQKSPWDKKIGKHTAVTRTEVDVQYQYEKRGQTCVIKDVKIYLHLTYLYPRLAHSVDGETRKWWNRFVKKLEEHELIHGTISTDAVFELDDELKSLNNVTCPNIKAMVKNRYNRFWKKLRRKQTAYDELTEHGIHQERNRGRYP